MLHSIPFMVVVGLMAACSSCHRTEIQRSHTMSRYRRSWLLGGRYSPSPRSVRIQRTSSSRGRPLPPRSRPTGLEAEWLFQRSSVEMLPRRSYPGSLSCHHSRMWVPSRRYRLYKDPLDEFFVTFHGWPLIHRRITTSPTHSQLTLGGHTGWVRAVATYDKYLFSCGCNYLRQWDCTFATPKELNSVKLFTGEDDCEEPST